MQGNPRTWFITADRQPVVWATAVADGVATVTIYRLEETVTAETRTIKFLFRRAGSLLRDDEVQAAQMLASTDPVPAADLPDPPPARPGLVRSLAIDHIVLSAVQPPDMTNTLWLRPQAT